MLGVIRNVPFGKVSCNVYFEMSLKRFRKHLVSYIEVLCFCVKFLVIRFLNFSLTVSCDKFFVNLSCQSLLHRIYS